MICICFPATITLAQSISNTPYNTYDFEAIRTGGQFKDVISDEEGKIWIASDNGLISFDGKQTKYYQSLLSSEYVKAFLRKKDGKILVLHDDGLDQFNLGQEDGERLSVTSILKGSGSLSDSVLLYPKSIYEDRNGVVWISDDLGVVKWQNGAMKRFTFPGLVNPNDYHSTFLFAEDGFGTLWTISRRGALFFFDRGKDAFERVGLPQQLPLVGAMSPVGENRIWIGTGEALFELQTSKQHKVALSNIPEGPKNISKIIQNGKEVYLGTWNDGVYKTDLSENDSQPFFQPFQNLPFQDIVNMYLNNAGLWLCGNENISLICNTVFDVQPIGGNQNLIETATLDFNGELIISEGQKIWQLSSNFQGVEEQLLYSNKEQYTKVPFKTQKGLWLGGAFGRVQYIDQQTGNAKTFGEHTNQFITNFFEDVEGNIWAAGSFKVGLIKITPEGDTHYFKEEGIREIQVIKQRDGRFFAAGLAPNLIFEHLPNDRFRSIHLFLADRPSVKFTIEDFAFYQGKCYLATSKGLMVTADDNLSADTLKVEALPLERFNGVFTHSVCFTDDGACWAANIYGLIRLKEGELLYFNRASGLPSRIIKPRGLLVDPAGKLWISTARGLSYLIAHAIVAQQTPTPQLKSFKLNSKAETLKLGELPTFPAESDIELALNTITFPSNQIFYRYQLIDNQSDTLINEISVSPNRPFFNLQSGDYRLLVAAKQETGHSWSEPYVLSFSIGKHWLQNPWWVLLLVICSVAAIYGLIRLYNWNLLKNNQQLERLVQERTQALAQKQTEVIEQQKQIIEQKNELLEKKQNLNKTQQALTATELNFRKSKAEQLQNELDYRNKQLTTHALHILQKSELLKELSQQIDKILQQPEKNPGQDLKKIKKTVDNSLHFEKDWNDFRLYFEQVHTDFYSKLKINYPNLTSQELKHCALIKLNLPVAECASVLGISQESVKTSRFRLRKKIDLPDQQSLTEFLISI